jgi:hypothetical protein
MNDSFEDYLAGIRKRERARSVESSRPSWTR